MADLRVRHANHPTAWPPLCDDCGWQHIGHCDDDASNRTLMAAICAHLDEVIRHVTPMADVPPALRGPNWKADT